MDLWKLVKIWFQKIWFDISYYNKNKYKWLIDLDINSIFDIWANEWQFAEEIHYILPKEKIYEFEPIKKCFEKVQKKINLYWEAFNYWIWEENKDVTFYHNEFSASSSILKMDNLHKEIFPFTENENEEKIKIKKLDNLDLKYKKNILLKIDVQWYEKQVLIWWKEFLKDVKVIILETSFCKLYEWWVLFDEIYQILTKEWFKYNWSWFQLCNQENWEILQQDAIFIKK